MARRWPGPRAEEGRLELHRMLGASDHLAVRGRFQLAAPLYVWFTLFLCFSWSVCRSLASSLRSLAAPLGVAVCVCVPCFLPDLRLCVTRTVFLLSWQFMQLDNSQAGHTMKQWV